MRRLVPTLLLPLLACACTPTNESTGVDAPELQVEAEPEAQPSPATELDADPLLGFRHHGAPIHPLAVSAMIPLEQPSDEPLTIVLPDMPTLDDAVELDGAHVSFDDPEPGWDAYEVHDRQGSRFLLGVKHSGGGTGVFSSVVVAEFRGDELVPALEIPAGDRCNGGLAEAPRFDGDAILVPRWLTPYDLVALSSRDIGGITAYEDLESSAMSCVGYVVIRREADGEQQPTQVVFAPGIDGRWHADQPDWTDHYRLQPRFNQIYANWIAAGETVLDPAAIDRFVDELLGN